MLGTNATCSRLSSKMTLIFAGLTPMTPHIPCSLLQATRLLGLQKWPDDKKQVYLWHSLCFLDALVYPENFSNICLGPPQYKHKWFAQHRHFLALDNGPCMCAVLISIGMGLFTKMGLSTCIGVIDGATTTKVYVLFDLCVASVGVWNIVQVNDYHIICLNWFPA